MGIREDCLRSHRWVSLRSAGNLLRWKPVKISKSILTHEVECRLVTMSLGPSTLRTYLESLNLVRELN